MSPEAALAETTSWLQSPSSIVSIVVGALLLLAGRRLFWLVVGAVGFATGFWLAEAYISVGSDWVHWAVAILAGALAALAAVFLQRFAIAAGGALIAGYSAWWYLSLTWQPLEVWHWAVVVAATVIGALVARTVFDFGLIFVSALAGATLLLENLPVTPAASRWLFLVLVVLGAAVQASTLPGKAKKKS
mgnify:CR=1 FL=1